MTTDNYCFYLQNRLIQTSQTGGQEYSDTSPFSIPWLNRCFTRYTRCGSVYETKLPGLPEANTLAYFPDVLFIKNESFVA